MKKEKQTLLEDKIINKDNSMEITAFTNLLFGITLLALVEDNFLDLFNVDVVSLSRLMIAEDDKWHDVKIHGIDAQYPTWFHFF